MNNKEKDIVSLFNELMSMFNELLSENIELKKLIKRYRNDPNAKFEPTEEELNSLFMDKQVDPDEQDMYLNPEKHTGGDKTKKDIEFEAEKLVKSVKDYADSIQNKNLKIFVKAATIDNTIAAIASKTNNSIIVKPLLL